MIVADTSALYAIIAEEPDATTYLAAIARCERVLVGAPTALELLMVARGKLGDRGIANASELMSDRPIEIVAWTPDLVAIAARASASFCGRPARLNFGDCVSYALAKQADVPLLYKGDDFARTDIRSALD